MRLCVSLFAVLVSTLVLLGAGCGGAPPPAPVVAAALMVALAYASVVKALFLSKLLDAPVNGWRWTLMIAVGVASAVGYLVTYLPEWAELIVGIPLILGSYAWVIWKWGFGPEDRKLFKMKG